MKEIMSFDLITEDEINDRIASIQTEIDDIDKIELEIIPSIIYEFIIRF